MVMDIGECGIKLHQIVKNPLLLDFCSLIPSSKIEHR